MRCINCGGTNRRVPCGASLSVRACVVAPCVLLTGDSRRIRRASTFSFGLSKKGHAFLVES